jgi:hypothetical protein
MSQPNLRSLAAYLDQAGWQRVDEDRRTSLWRFGRHDVVVVLPVVQEVADYGDRIEEALRVLSFVERRLPSEIVADMAFGGADTLAVRLTPDAPPGEAPLELACAAVEALRGLVVASAAALVVDSLVLPLRRPARAEAYAKQTRLSTQSGSFVLSLAMPLQDAYEESVSRTEDDEGMLVRSADLPRVDPFGRRVTNRLFAAASAAVELADEVYGGSQSISAFGEGRPGAPNATELASLASLGGPEHDLYQLRIARSPLAGVRQGATVTPISPGQQRVFAEASEFLRTKQPRSGVTVVGLVVRLFRDRSSGPGEVVILGEDDDSGSPRRYRVELVEQDYNRAVDAHGRGLQVQVEGDLEIRGTRLSLRRLSFFGVIPGIDDDDC